MIVYRTAPPKDGKPARSATTFGSITDGTSNTAMFGEKHMLKDWLGGKYDEPAFVAINDQNTIRLASNVELDEKDKEVAKLRGLAADDSDDKDKEKEKDKDDWKFGSAIQA